MADIGEKTVKKGEESGGVSEKAQKTAKKAILSVKSKVDSSASEDHQLSIKSVMQARKLLKAFEGLFIAKATTDEQEKSKGKQEKKLRLPPKKEAKKRIEVMRQAIVQQRHEITQELIAQHAHKAPEKLKDFPEPAVLLTHASDIYDALIKACPDISQTLDFKNPPVFLTHRNINIKKVNTLDTYVKLINCAKALALYSNLLNAISTLLNKHEDAVRTLFKNLKNEQYYQMLSIIIRYHVPYLVVYLLECMQFFMDIFIPKQVIDILKGAEICSASAITEFLQTVSAQLNMSVPEMAEAQKSYMLIISHAETLREKMNAEIQRIQANPSAMQLLSQPELARKGIKHSDPVDVFDEATTNLIQELNTAHHAIWNSKVIMEEARMSAFLAGIMPEVAPIYQSAFGASYTESGPSKVSSAPDSAFNSGVLGGSREDIISESVMPNPTQETDVEEDEQISTFSLHT